MDPLLAVALIVLLVVSIWAAIRSEHPLRDDEQSTTDVQNHVGDSRPVRLAHDGDSVIGRVVSWAEDESGVTFEVERR